MPFTKRLAAFEEKHFRQWVERDRRRKDLDKESRALKGQNDLVAADLLQGLKENDKTELVRGAFRGFIGTKKEQVSWKDEFLRRVGAEVAAEIAANVDDKEFAAIEAI